MIKSLEYRLTLKSALKQLSGSIIFAIAMVGMGIYMTINNHVDSIFSISIGVLLYSLLSMDSLVLFMRYMSVNMNTKMLTGNDYEITILKKKFLPLSVLMTLKKSSLI